MDFTPWIPTPNSALLITVTPPTDTNPVGSDHTVTATITDGAGVGQGGISVRFRVISGPNNGLEYIAPTATPSGQVSWTYVGTGGAGTDVIETCYAEPTFGETVCGQTVTKVWNAVTGVEITLAPPYDLNLVGQDHTVTATVQEVTGLPLVGQTVTFTVISGPNVTLFGTDTTNASGQATFTYSNTIGVGSDLIQACVGDDPPVCSNVVEKEWAEEVIDLDPYFATNLIGTDHSVTAIIVDTLGNPVPGVLVTFTILSGPNAGDSGTGTTNASGQATFLYTGDNGPGMDVIEACFTNAAGTVVCTFDDAYKEWTEAPPPPPQQVPGLSDWGAILVALLLLASAVWMLRRRRNLE